MSQIIPRASGDRLNGLYILDPRRHLPLQGHIVAGISAEDVNPLPLKPVIQLIGAAKAFTGG